MSAYCPFKSTTRSAVGRCGVGCVCKASDLIGCDLWESWSDWWWWGLLHRAWLMWARCQKASFPRQRITMRTKGLTAQPRERRARRGDQAKEWSLTPDLLDIILKMQINLCFRNWSRTTRGQTSPWNQTKHPGITYTLKTKIHSKHMFQQFFYKSNSSTQSHKQTVRPKTHRKKVKKNIILVSTFKP